MKSIQMYTIESNEALTQDVWRMVLKGDTSWIERPGQFVNLLITGQYLRRPISVADWNEETLTLIYKIVGEGTKKMAALKCQEVLEALTGLGNGFELQHTPKKILLIGGGVGVPPLYGLAKKALEIGKQVTVLLGFKSQHEAFYLEEFAALGAQVLVSTNDGSLGTKGFVTTVMEKEGLLEETYFVCGPVAMLKAVHQLSRANGQLSLEERMGCGFGACMGCSCKTKEGPKRLCVEGPVLKSEEILWED